jgi:hypothetical protein
MKFRIKIKTFALVPLALVAICALSVLLPDKSLAALNDIACDALWRGCLNKCGPGGNTQSCTDKCDNNRADCQAGRPDKKQQTPPPPCTGIHCTLRPTHPPTTVGPTTPLPRPVKPVNPVGVSNPNKPTTGTGEPTILLRKNDSGGGPGQEHGHGH